MAGQLLNDFEMAQTKLRSYFDACNHLTGEADGVQKRVPGRHICSVCNPTSLCHLAHDLFTEVSDNFFHERE